MGAVRRARWLAVLAGIVCCSIGAPAAGTEAAPGPQHRIEPGDTIEVRLWNEADNVKEFVVAADGSVQYPLIGTVILKGLTADEAANRLTEQLKTHIKEPIVTVTLKASARALEKRVHALGEVSKPGSYAYTDGMRVIDLLSLAGGVTQNAEARNSILNRDGKSTPLDLRKMLGEGDMSQNLALNPDDVLVVPGRGGMGDGIVVTILGQVNRPGTHPLPSGAKVSDAMVAANGLAPTAAGRKATITRAGLSAPLDLDAILNKGDLSGSIALQDGDLIFVPEARNEVTLLGQFQKPGLFNFRDGDTILTAVTLGGGPTPKADASCAVLKRGGKEIPIDLDAMLNRAEMKDDQPLQNGDVLYIPEGTQVYVFGAVGRPGPVTYKRQGTLMDVLVAAGGPLPNANLAKVGVVRETDGKSEAIPLKIVAAQGQAGEPIRFDFRQGDVLYIPAKGRRFDWRDVIGTLYQIRILGSTADWLLR